MHSLSLSLTSAQPHTFNKRILESQNSFATKFLFINQQI